MSERIGLNPDEHQGDIFGTAGQLHRRLCGEGAKMMSLFFNEGSLKGTGTKFKSLFFIELTYHDQRRNNHRGSSLLRLRHLHPCQRHTYAPFHKGEENFSKSFLRIIDND